MSDRSMMRGVSAVAMMKISDIRMRDPFILEPEPGAFVLYGTTDENVWHGPATGFDCYTSTDLTTWSGPIAAFRPAEDFWSHSQFWAPEVHGIDGRFFMFATFLSAKTGARGVGILVADEPSGPFEPWSDGPVTPAGVPCLDGTLHVDADGTRWLVYSRGAEGTAAGLPAIADGEMYAMRLSDDLTRAEGAPHLLFRASDAAWSRPLQFPPGAPSAAEMGMAEDPLLTDGPSLVQSPDGSLFMLWSSFGDEGYAMGVAVSESGGILGPWAQNDEPLWARNGGHGMILRTSAGVDYLAFHTPNDTPRERATLIPVEVTDRGVALTPEYSTPAPHADPAKRTSAAPTA